VAVTGVIGSGADKRYVIDDPWDGKTVYVNASDLQRDGHRTTRRRRRRRRRQLRQQRDQQSELVGIDDAPRLWNEPSGQRSTAMSANFATSTPSTHVWPACALANDSMSTLLTGTDE
jgi:hypothetical protein